MKPIDFADLKTIFARWMRWYRLRRGVDWASYGLVAGLCIGVCSGSLAMYQGWLLRAEFYLLAGYAAITGIITVFVVGAAWPIKSHQAARIFDQAFDLKERILTAMEYSHYEPRTPGSAELVSKQLADTLFHARQINYQRALPLLVRRINLLWAGLLGLSMLLIAWRGTPMFNAAGHQRQVKQAIAEEIEQIETLQSNIEDDSNLTPQAQQELIQILEETTRQLQQAETAEEAISILEETQKSLTETNNSQAQSLFQALKSAGTSFSQQANNPLASIGQQLVEGEIAAAAKELASLETGNLSTEQRQDLAEQLSEAAQPLQSATPELSESLQQAADALKTGNQQAAQKALTQAAQSLQSSSTQIAQAEAAAQAANQVAASQMQILQADQGAGSNGGQSGQGGSSQTAQGEASGGAGHGDNDNGDGIGPEAGNEPISQNNAPGDGGESAYQVLYPPDRLGGSSDMLVSIPSSAETGELILGLGDTAPGAQSRTTVAYTQVYGYYSQAYRQAIENGDIPPGMRNLVRDYFTSLEP